MQYAVAVEVKKLLWDSKATIRLVKRNTKIKKRYTKLQASKEEIIRLQ